MMTPEETWLEQALEHEQRTMQRQTLLKRLWKLQQSRADHNELMTTAADEANGRSLYTVSSSRRVISPAARSDEAAALRA
ncbi:MAG: hypothetical protein H6822_02625 [Planctomycetaceae bacterium]|nr:hypothetical protein [Planctomycetales bacterium]MCB9921046.1 hypothetical protein [Planctomycetaceae bacterium]